MDHNPHNLKTIPEKPVGYLDADEFIAFCNRKNIIIMLMSIELMLLAINLALIAYAIHIDDIIGQMLALFVITVAAAEAAVGLAILLSLYRNRVTIDMESFNLLRW